MTADPVAPPGYRFWRKSGDEIIASERVADAVREAIDGAASLAAWAESRATARAETGRGVVYRARLGPVDAAVRHYHRGGRAGPLLGDRYFARPPRPFVELSVSERLRSAGVPTPRVLAAVVRPSWVGYRGDLATEWVEPGHDLEQLLAPNRYPDPARAAALRAAGVLVARAHDAGLDHPDLNIGNIFVQPLESGDWKAWLLDLDRAQLDASRDHRSANLDRFRRSLEKRRSEGRVAWTEDDWDVFSMAHRQAAGRG